MPLMVHSGSEVLSVFALATSLVLIQGAVAGAATITSPHPDGHFVGALQDNTQPAALSPTSHGEGLVFQPRLVDADLGRYVARAWVCDPWMGTFLQVDPSGYADSPNLYAGFANDPVNRRDPTGRVSPFVVGGAILGLALIANDQDSNLLGPLLGAAAGWMAGTAAAAGEAVYAVGKLGPAAVASSVEAWVYGGGLYHTGCAAAGALGEDPGLDLCLASPGDEIGRGGRKAIQAEQAIHETAALGSVPASVEASIAGALTGTQPRVGGSLAQGGELVAGSSSGFDKGQRAMADQLGIRRVPTKANMHAEENILAAEPRIEAIGTSVRKPCGPLEHNCRDQLTTRLVRYDLELERLAAEIRGAGGHPASRNNRVIGVGRTAKNWKWGPE